MAFLLKLKSIEGKRPVNINSKKGECRMKHLLLILFFLIGCITTKDSELSGLKKPVIIIAMERGGTVVVQGSDGVVVTISRSYHMAKAISESRKIGDTLISIIK